MWRIQKSNSFFQFFPFSFSFLPQFVKKVFFLRFLWNVLYNLIMIWKIQKSNSFSQIFSFSVLLLPWLVKNVLKNGWKIFFSDFHENCQLNFDVNNSKIKFILPNFFLFIFIFGIILFPFSSGKKSKSNSQCRVQSVQKSRYS